MPPEHTRPDGGKASAQQSSRSSGGAGCGLGLSGGFPCRGVCLVVCQPHAEGRLRDAREQ